MAKQYELTVDARILELLGPNLYTNIYYVLAELIANAYDADAKNVYVVEESDAIRVEDDGRGMSYAAGDVTKFLNVARVSRTTEEEAVTPSGRRKMGRKGVGKLAALSVSESVDVLTTADGEKSGFVLTRHPPEDRLLQAIPDDDITFSYATDRGTAIVMQSPEYGLHKTMAAVKRNLLKLFPVVSSDFRIHVIRGTEAAIIDDFDGSVMNSMSTLITLGAEFSSLAALVPDSYPDRRSDLVDVRDPFVMPIVMKNVSGEEPEYELKIEGWIGTYKSTRELKAERTDFPDNFISLFANGKLGEFNILPAVGQNRLSEVYVVGQLHVDLFELTELPDMALSNRQGYKSDDPRYEVVLNFVRELLADVRRRRDIFADLRSAAKKKQKEEEQLANEARLRASVDGYRKKVTESASEALELLGVDGTSRDVRDAIGKALSEHSPDLGLKALVDTQKKKVLISHASGDKALADVIYQMLLYNNISADEVIYTSSEDQDSRIPHGQEVWEYLRDFFVDSYSTEKVLVLFVTSKKAETSWGAVLEVGAAWITKKGHEIFNISPYTPKHPLDVHMQWQTTNRDKRTKSLSMDQGNADVLCQKAEAVCDELGYPKQSRAANMTYLGTLVTVSTS